MRKLMKRETIRTAYPNRKTIYFGFLCCLVYFTSYFTRINYGAVLVEIIRDLEITKDVGSIAVAGSFITYSVRLCVWHRSPVVCLVST